MDEHSIYDDRAELYDLLYGFKDYAADAERLHGVLLAEGIEDGSRLVEAACGTGSFLVPLRSWYEVAGYDLEEGMLAVARRKLPGVDLFAADMCECVLDEPADVLACLFSSIGYAHPEDRMRAAIRCFAGSVRPGGVVLVEPWIRPEKWRNGMPHLDTYADDEVKIARAVVSDAEGRLSKLEMHWLVARANEGTEHFVDTHHLMMYTEDEYRAAFEAAGLSARYLSGEGYPDRGLYVATRTA